MASGCFQWFKDTNLKANHNRLVGPSFKASVVSNGSKILIWKQITTSAPLLYRSCRCFQWFKDTNLKANHNTVKLRNMFLLVVSNGSKILIWKQITTWQIAIPGNKCCFQWFKDTNLKANHNNSAKKNRTLRVVSNGSKILIWKQITTRSWTLFWAPLLFPMVQRY